MDKSAQAADKEMSPEQKKIEELEYRLAYLYHAIVLAFDEFKEFNEKECHDRPFFSLMPVGDIISSIRKLWEVLILGKEFSGIDTAYIGDVVRHGEKAVELLRQHNTSDAVIAICKFYANTERCYRLFMKYEDPLANVSMSEDIMGRAIDFTEESEKNIKKIEENCEGCKRAADSELESIKDVRREAEEKLTRIKEIFGMVGDDAINGLQKRYADDAKRRFRCLFWSAVAITIGLGGCWAYVLGSHSTLLDGWNILRMIPMSICFGGTAIYVFHESAVQRDREHKYRDLEMKMASITPYFEGIGNECVGDSKLPEKDRVKLELAKSLLSPSDEGIIKALVGKGDWIDQLLKFAEKTVNIIKSFKK